MIIPHLSVNLAAEAQLAYTRKLQVIEARDILESHISLYQKLGLK